MKRNITRMLIALYLILFIPFGSISAEEDNVGKKPILDIIAETERANIPDDDLIYNTDIYSYDMKGYDYTDTFIFKCYDLYAGGENICGAFAAAKYLPGETVKDNFYGPGEDKYAIMDERPFVATVIYRNEVYHIDKCNGEQNQAWRFRALEDIRSNAVYDSALNPQNVRYNDVICFQTAPWASFDHGMVVYYISGDNNSLVYYYPDHDSEAIQFTLADFKIYGPKFDDFRRTDEYNEKVAGLGASYEFLDYLEEFYPEMAKGSTVPNPDVSYPDEESLTDKSHSQDENSITNETEKVQADISSGIKPWVLVVCSAGAFVMGVMVTVLITKRKK